MSAAPDDLLHRLRALVEAGVIEDFELLDTGLLVLTWPGGSGEEPASPWAPTADGQVPIRYAPPTDGAQVSIRS